MVGKIKQGVQMVSKVNPMYLIGGLLLFVFVFLGKRIRERFNTARTVNEWFGTKNLKEGSDGENISLSAIAYEIYDAFYNNDYLGLTEDEAAAIAAVQKVHPRDMKQLAKEYAKIGGRNKVLMHDLNKYLSSAQKSAIKDWL